MNVIIAKKAGFCFGVKRAIDLAFEIAKSGKGGVVTLGPIIHNPQVIEKLKAAGVRPVESIDDIGPDITTVIVRTHGIPEEDMVRLQGLGVEVIDATCPFVKKAQRYAKLLKDNGYKVVILGDREHPEVKGLVSHAGGGAVVVKAASECPVVRGRVGIIVQTTKHMDDLKQLLPVVIENAGEMQVYNTICNSTALKLKETEELARQSDVMIIVGGKNSSNTTRLASLSQSLGVPTHHIETAAELREEWFAGVKTVGLTAGASTPDWLIQEVKDRLRDTGGKV